MIFSHKDLKENIFDKIDRLADLQEGWDSYGGKPVNKTTRSGAKLVLADLMGSGVFSTFPEITPTCSGGIQAEWRNGGVELELCFNPGSGKVDVCFCETLKDSVEDFRQLHGLVRYFAQRVEQAGDEVKL